MPSLNFNKNKYYVLKRNIIVPIRNDWKYIDKNCLYSINSIGQSGIILAKYLNTKTVIANAIRFKQKC